MHSLIFIHNLMHGERPKPFDLVAIWAVFFATFAVVIWALGLSLSHLVMAFMASDWVAGIVANASHSTRAWWRARPVFRKIFYAVHLIEVPLVLWLAPSLLVALLMLLALAIKLVVFAQGGKACPAS